MNDKPMTLVTASLLIGSLDAGRSKVQRHPKSCFRALHLRGFIDWDGTITPAGREAAEVHRGNRSMFPCRICRVLVPCLYTMPTGFEDCGRHRDTRDAPYRTEESGSRSDWRYHGERNRDV